MTTRQQPPQDDQDDDLELDGTETTDGASGGDAGDDEGLFDSELDDALTEALNDDGVDDEETAELAEGLDADTDDLDDEDDDEDEEEGEDGDAEGAPAAAAAASAGEGAAPAAGSEAAAAAATETTAPAWEPLTVTADKAAVPIEEARILRREGHVYIAVPEPEFARFQARIGRGVVGEKMWRTLNQGLQEVEAERQKVAEERSLLEAVPRKSEAEIEAEEVLAALKPHLADLLDEKDQELLDKKVKLRVIEEGRAWDERAKTWREERQQEAAQQAEAANEEDTALQGIAEVVVTLVESHPELSGMTEAQTKAAYQELARMRRAVYWREGGEWLANTQLAFDILKRYKSTSPAVTPAPAPAATSSATATASGSPSQAPASAATTDAARFNRGVESAAGPTTTSVKARRSAGKGRPPEGTTRTDRAARRRNPATRDPQMDAEDEYRQMRKNLLRSDTLEF